MALATVVSAAIAAGSVVVAIVIAEAAVVVVLVMAGAVAVHISCSELVSFFLYLIVTIVVLIVLGCW